MSTNLLRSKFAEILRHEIVRAKVRQNAIAAKLGVSASAISQLLQGKIVPSMTQLNMMNEMLGLDRHRSFELRCMLSRIRCGEDTLQSPLGELLSRYRHERGFSIEELSRSAQIPETTLEEMENAADIVPDVADLQRLALVLRCPIDELFMAAGMDRRVYDDHRISLTRDFNSIALRESQAVYTPYSEPAAAGKAVSGVVVNMKFKEFWRKLSSIKGGAHGDKIAEVMKISADTALDVVATGADFELAAYSSWKLSIRSFKNLSAGELALVRERGSSKPTIMLLDSLKGALVGRRLFRKSNKATPITEELFDIIVPVSSMEFLPYGRM